MNKFNSYKILLVEDDEMYQIGLQKSLEKSRFNIIAITTVQQQIPILIKQYNPLLAIIDLNLHGNSSEGLSILQTIHLSFPQIKTLILTSTLSFEVALKCFQFGAKGYLIKSSNANQLQLALNTIQKNAIYLDPLLASKFQCLCNEAIQNFEGFQKNQIYIKENPTIFFNCNLSSLSEKEQEVLRLVGFGFSNEEISEHLSLPINTVKSIIARVFNKLKLRNRATAAVRAYQLGLIA